MPDNLLRFVMVGSVDDGKSTLLGRLFYETQNIPQDQLEALQLDSSSNTYNFAHFTDGLKAERDQGITIDVAYRFFRSKQRIFIVADAPGHFQYTANMFTAASQADLAVVLVDATIGISEQTRRHLAICRMLKIEHLLICINKMDTHNYCQNTFKALQEQILSYLSLLPLPKNLIFIPTSGLKGDNVAKLSSLTPWYKGKSLLSYLEEIDIKKSKKINPFCLTIQLPLRYEHYDFFDFRGYAGRIVSGSCKKGDLVSIYPSGLQTTIKEIFVSSKECLSAQFPQSVVMTFKDQISIARGDIVAHPIYSLKVNTEIYGTICWIDLKPLESGHRYCFKHLAMEGKSVVQSVSHKLELQTLIHKKASRLVRNEIGTITLKISAALYHNYYSTHQEMGSFILIDEQTKNTVCVGIIEDPKHFASID